MKILDKYLLKSFLVTFTSVFVILFFIFVLQVIWLFISDLAGKDLDTILIAKFLLFKMPSVVPLVLPLSVLLASIMTFGSFAENYEFAAMKSSGISLQRTMRSLTYFILILSIVAFIFANNVIPYADYKFNNFRRNIAQVKPAMAIAEGQFSKIGNYTIKVEKKSGDNGRFLSLVTIHKKSVMGDGNNTVIKAKNGELISNENSNILKLVLKDGDYYEDIIPSNYDNKNKFPFAKSAFKRYVLNIDLSKLGNNNLDDAQIANTNTMPTVGELRYTIDSLQKNYAKDAAAYTENIYLRSNLNQNGFNSAVNNKHLDVTDVLKSYTTPNKIQILRVASSNVDAIKFSLENSKFELKEKQKNINQHWIAFYDKFVIGFSCILMFFIGAPLGAIIKKGGLGLPIVFAVVIFIAYHFINSFGKRVAQEDGISAFMGCWMSTMVLLPLAVVFTKRATEDKGISINFDWAIFLFQKLFPTKEESELESQNNSLSETQKTETSRSLFLNEKDSLSETHTKLDSSAIISLQATYKKYSRVAFSVYTLLLIIVVWSHLDTPFFNIIALIISILFYFTAYKAQQALYQIGIYSHKKIDLNTITVLLGGFPFYLLFYGFNTWYLKELLSHTKPTV